jgi:hypothetical protein
MNLVVPKEHTNTMNSLTAEIVDEDRTDTVGEITFEKGGGRHIVLFGRYKGTVKTHAEAVAFVKGVQTVLEHMIDVSRAPRPARQEGSRSPRHRAVK